MKYINLNTKNQEEWQQGLNNYRFYLETIKSRFSKNFFQFYTQSGMHDSILIEFQVTKRQLARRTCIDIKTQWKKNDKYFSLLFKDVTKIMADIDLINGYLEFGDCIIGEFLEFDEKYLSFEFLLYDSSNTVKIVFKRLYYKSVQ